MDVLLFLSAVLVGTVIGWCVAGLLWLGFLWVFGDY